MKIFGKVGTMLRSLGLFTAGIAGALLVAVVVALIMLLPRREPIE